MGGAGGHMRHPHDLKEVDNGQDIIALFRAIPGYLRSEEFKSGQTTSLKLDGSNNAIKVVEDGDGGIQFAVDRGGKGTSPETKLDVMGVTIDRLKDRFTKVNKRTGEIKYNEGLANSSAGLINMMARAYNENKDVMFGLLKGLGLIDDENVPDSTKFINIEYIDRVPEDINPETGRGRANAIYYTFDSITFLNISQFYKVVADVTRKDPVTGKSLKAPDGKVLKDKDVLVRDGAEITKDDMVDALDNNGKPIKKPPGDTSKSIDFDGALLDELAKLVAPYAPKSKSGQQFHVLGPGDLNIRVKHNLADDSTEEEIAAATQKTIEKLQQDIENTLNSDLTFVISRDTAVTKSLEEWLSLGEKGIPNFGYKPDIKVYVKDANGNIALDDAGNPQVTSAGPFTKNIHDRLVIQQEPLSELLPFDPKLCTFDNSEIPYDCEKAIYGAIFYEAARRLGTTVQRAIAAKVDKFGDAVDHEGIVINAGMPFGDKVTSNTFKLTGEFIVSGQEGVYAQMLREEIEDEDLDPVVDEEFTGRTIALVPGSMKPPTVGHAGMIKRYSELVASKPNGKVYVFVSNPTAIYQSGAKKGQLKSARGFPGRQQGISQVEAIDLLMKMLPEYFEKKQGQWEAIGNIELISTPHASPMSPVYDFVSPNDIPNIIQAMPGDTVILGSSTKGGDSDRWNDIINNQDIRVRPGVEVRNMPVDPVTHSSTEDGLSYLDYLRSSEGYEMLNSLPTVLKARKKNPNLDVQNIDLTNISASDARYLMGFMHDEVPEWKRKIAKNLIRAFFGENTKQVLQHLGYEPKDTEELEEMAGVAAVAGGVGSLGTPRRRNPYKKKSTKKKKQQENVDTTLIDDVMRLIMERGIMQ